MKDFQFTHLAFIAFFEVCHWFLLTWAYIFLFLYFFIWVMMKLNAILQYVFWIAHLTTMISYLQNTEAQHKLQKYIQVNKLQAYFESLHRFVDDLYCQEGQQWILKMIHLIISCNFFPKVGQWRLSASSRGSGGTVFHIYGSFILEQTQRKLHSK